MRNWLLFPLLLISSSLAIQAEPLPVPQFRDAQRRAKLQAAFPEIERIFEAAQRQRGIPGLAFGIVIDGELALVKTFGVRDRAAKDPVTPDTVFRIASMTKSFTALAILQLRDAGKLSLDDPVSKWIPEAGRFRFPTQDSAPLRVRHLLTHSAGFPEDNPWGDRQLGIPDPTMTKWLATGLPFSTPPGTAYEYSNYGFALLGRIVSQASGMPYRQYLEQRILSPLGMKSSTLEPEAVPSGTRAVGYGQSGGEYREIPSLPHGSFGAMGGLLTSSRDLARYVAFQLAAWPPRDGEDSGPVSRSSRREMQSMWRFSGMTVNRDAPDSRLKAVASGYGYGLRISQDCRFGHVVGHGGGLPGFGSYMLWLPEYGVGFFEMGNLTYAGLASVIGDALLALDKTGALQPRQLPPSPVLLSTRDDLVSLWRNWDDRRAAGLAADNLFPDTPASERRAEVERMKKTLGACDRVGDVSAENLLRGSFRMNCERGAVNVSFTLAPTAPPKVQFLRFEIIQVLNAGMKTAVTGLVAQIASPADDRLGAIAATTFDTAGFRRSLDPVRAAYGSCRMGEPVAGDGATDARVRLDCDRGALDLRVRLDSGGKVTAASFATAPGVSCVP